jgi:peptidoglycan/xylan/chitin deacetylase (PgdA/CDA1 family)
METKTQADQEPRWSHPSLITLTASQVISQMTQLETALLDIIGKYPTYMRPPYLDIDAKTLTVLGTLGYSVIMNDLNPQDWYENFKH